MLSLSCRNSVFANTLMRENSLVKKQVNLQFYLRSDFFGTILFREDKGQYMYYSYEPFNKNFCGYYWKIKVSVCFFCLSLLSSDDFCFVVVLLCCLNLDVQNLLPKLKGAYRFFVFCFLHGDDELDFFPFLLLYCYVSRSPTGSDSVRQRELYRSDLQ